MIRNFFKRQGQMIQARLTVTHLKKTGEEPRMFRVNREESFRKWNSPNATWEPAPLTVYHVPNPWTGSKFFADLNKFIEAKWMQEYLEASHGSICPVRHRTRYSPLSRCWACWAAWFQDWVLTWWFVPRFNSWSSLSLGLLSGLLIYAHDLFLTTVKTYSR